MTRARCRARACAAAALTVALLGCGAMDGDGAAPTGTPDLAAAGAPIGASGREARVLAVASGLQSLFAGGGEGVSAPRAVPGGFSPEAIAAEPGAYRLVQINALGLAEPARVIQENGDEITLAFQSGPTAAFDGGILTATRGFGDDLFTLDAPGLLGTLRAGGGSLTRRMETLGDQDQIVTTTFACTVTAAGSEEIDLATRRATARRVEERCESEALVFNNVYWLDGQGDLLASQQFVSSSVAYLRSNRL